MKIGIQELLVVFIVALIVLGPDKLPLYARKFGEALREFRKFSSDATKDIRESIVEPLEEAQRPLKEALEPITELEKEVRGDMEGIQKSFSDIGKPAKADKNSRTEAERSRTEALGHEDVSDSDAGTAAAHEAEPADFHGEGSVDSHEAEPTDFHGEGSADSHEAEPTAHEEGSADLHEAKPEISREAQSVISMG